MGNTVTIFIVDCSVGRVGESEVTSFTVTISAPMFLSRLSLFFQTIVRSTLEGKYPLCEAKGKARKML